MLTKNGEGRGGERINRTLASFAFGSHFSHPRKLPSSPRKATALSLQFLVIFKVKFNGIQSSIFVPRVPAADPTPSPVP